MESQTAAVPVAKPAPSPTMPCKDCDSDPCRCEDWIKEDDAYLAAPSPTMKDAATHVSVAFPNDGGPAVILPDPCHDPRDGFMVEILMHTDNARKQLTDPETVRHRVGFGLEANSELEEEVDYTLKASRAMIDVIEEDWLPTNFNHLILAHDRDKDRLDKISGLLDEIKELRAEIIALKSINDTAPTEAYSPEQFCMYCACPIEPCLERKTGWKHKHPWMPATGDMRCGGKATPIPPKQGVLLPEPAAPPEAKPTPSQTDAATAPACTYDHSKCPGCQWVNRNHLRDCPVRARYKELDALAHTKDAVEALIEEYCPSWNVSVTARGQLNGLFVELLDRRERMRQAVEMLKKRRVLSSHQARELLASKATSLLSPEGSTR